MKLHEIAEGEAQSTLVRILQQMVDKGIRVQFNVARNLDVDIWHPLGSNGIVSGRLLDGAVTTIDIEPTATGDGLVFLIGDHRQWVRFYDSEADDLLTIKKTHLGWEITNAP